MTVANCDQQRQIDRVFYAWLTAMQS